LFKLPLHTNHFSKNIRTWYILDEHHYLVCIRNSKHKLIHSSIESEKKTLFSFLEKSSFVMLWKLTELGNQKIHPYDFSFYTFPESSTPPSLLPPPTHTPHTRTDELHIVKTKLSLCTEGQTFPSERSNFPLWKNTRCSCSSPATLFFWDDSFFWLSTWFTKKKFSQNGPIFFGGT